MKSLLDTGIFKPSPSRTEAKTDATTRVARQIVDLEAAARSAKTERLRAARLAQEPQASAPKKPLQKRRSPAR
ncbi:hypothetical protein EN817_28215 [Mesorhizobium sp. M3A.F.Ca.ET.174.01.1.1]|uniref:hypothetical protein n=1 Tax=unclassified Mesorhizobium TaxID=325217 RepID=UPI001094044F|nr:MULTISPECIES: hypothetical protein [unclassified Mesorhizobium]TGS71564.1 hypothetical protein EN844_00745 [Mesorhizobium sp. M3A.F.Ca.ET.201.01.1.1]TGS82423.1 hypothetical protein EN818_27665 [Mesorhizobium sp. M3A.F.Ca.ET.175.01.1.1]TGT22245.1 hypothetical protein EN817_28215 [Mesorhizobium sp. M3A.F.Ca.ET.174.01.1.1]